MRLEKICLYAFDIFTFYRMYSCQSGIAFFQILKYLSEMPFATSPKFCSRSGNTFAALKCRFLPTSVNAFSIEYSWTESNVR